MSSPDVSTLRARFEAFWEEIRGARLYAGQPRSQKSAASVTLAREALRLAGSSGDTNLMFQASWMLAYSLTANEDYQESMSYWEQATATVPAGDPSLETRVRIGFVTALTHTGQYERALAVAGEAERSLRESGDKLRYARVCTNIGNIYHRLDQPNRSYDYYLTAAEIFQQLGERQAEAQVYLNLGNCLSQVYRFKQSDEMYERAERISGDLGLRELWIQSNYGRAYILYLRGRYGDALRAFAQLRGRFVMNGSTRYLALCDLDEAEIYLQLNLSMDAAMLATSARRHFESIGMAYEEGKAQAFYGSAMMQLRRFDDALATFASAQKIFEQEGNDYWVGVLDLQRADISLSVKRYEDARELALRARGRFEALGIPSRRIACLVVLGRVSLAMDDMDTALKHADEIFAAVAAGNMPLLMFPSYLLRARIADRCGDWPEADRHYRLAVEDMEAHQSRLRHDDLRTMFLQGRSQVYEALVRLSLDHSDSIGSHTHDVLGTAYAWCERAKSRGLIDLLSNHLPAFSVQGDPSQSDRIDRLREELNTYYIRSRPEVRPVLSIAEHDEIAFKERELAQMLRDISDVEPEYVSLQQGTGTTIEAAQASLPENVTMLEYFCADGEVLVFVIDRSQARVFRRLSTSDHIEMFQRRLAFQLESFLCGDDYLRAHFSQMSEATHHYLQSLFDVLVAPLLHNLRTPRLVIIPHGSLHFLPFHALFDGTSYLIDRFEVTYATSAAIFKRCQDKPDIENAPPLLVAVPDDSAPMVAAEVQQIGALFPDAQSMLGLVATRQSFGAAIQRSSFLHIATHAVFRQDNPLFSSFKLADGYVTALDLFSLTCQTNLVTLSGCKSGIGTIGGSDDLIGLMRGFLYAGARSLLLSLWNVNDESTLALMVAFYRELASGATKGLALKKAMQAVRQDFPSPFYWAPFVLSGKC